MPSTPTKPSPNESEHASDLSRAPVETVGEVTQDAAWDAWRARDAAAAAAGSVRDPWIRPGSKPVFAIPESVLQNENPPGAACAATSDPPVVPQSNPPGAQPSAAARPLEDPKHKRKRGRAARKAQRIKNHAQSARIALQDLREREPELAARWIELNGTRSRKLRSSSRARLSLALLSFWLELGAPAAYYRAPAKRKRGRGAAPTPIDLSRMRDWRCVRVCGITQAYLAETFGVSRRTIGRVYRELRRAKIIDSHQLPVGARGQYDYEVGRVRIHKNGARTQFAVARVYVFTSQGAKPALYRPLIPEGDVAAWAAALAA